MYSFDFTENNFSQCIPNKKAHEWFLAVYPILDKWNINTRVRVAAWLAQTGHESGNFNYLVENLNYSANRLTEVWPSLFPDVNFAEQYAGNPEKLANYVYANRNGNGDEDSGDGYRYRGRGIIQLTGKSNYKACSIGLYNNDTLLQFPDKLVEYNNAVDSACWYWTSRNLNEYADIGDMRTITIRINGGLNGYEDRLSRYQAALSIL